MKINAGYKKNMEQCDLWEKFKASVATRRFNVKRTQQAILDGMSTDKLYKDKKTMNGYLKERLCTKTY